MKKNIFLILVISLSILGCVEEQKMMLHCSDGLKCEDGNISITSVGVGSIYVDGMYTGKKTPVVLNLPKGEHSIGVGLDKERIYLRKKVETSEEYVNVHFSIADKVQPKKWKALFVGVPTVYGNSRTGECSTHFSKSELDDAYDFFKFNLKEHIEPFSYGTIDWQIERRDLTKPVQLSHSEKSDWYILEPEQGLSELDNVKPGEYDTVFLFWREEDDSCNFKSSYFGLAWLEPTSNETRRTGYVTVKFNPGDIGVAATLKNYKDNDPGVWTHEWLHVVIEKFYPDRNIRTPINAENKLILHSAQSYGYEYPWIDWYKDLISAQVPLGINYAGLGAEAFLECTIREAAKDEC